MYCKNCSLCTEWIASVCNMMIGRYLKEVGYFSELYVKSLRGTFKVIVDHSLQVVYCRIIMCMMNMCAVFM